MVTYGCAWERERCRDLEKVNSHSDPLLKKTFLQPPLQPRRSTNFNESEAAPD
jgi:hypothetical protein